MKKFLLIILGILLSLFGLVQALQLLGVIGAEISSASGVLAGVGLTILGLALGVACFKKAYKPALKEQGQ